LTDDVVCTSKYSPAALYRYIYYPDRLVQMPYPGMDIWEVLWKILTEPVFKGTLRGGLREFFQPRRVDLNGDESVGSFVSRRASKEMADNLLSAVVHGIYAGDIYQLSAKSLFGLQWWAEGEFGSIIRAAAELSSAGVQVLPREDVELLQRIGPQPLDELRQKLHGASVYSFEKGIEQLVASLEESLRRSPNVQFKLGAPVQRLEAVSTAEERKSYYSVDKIRVRMPSRTI
jgi:protoporphyrinogen/coproporphyrinogen III oxidase